MELELVFWRPSGSDSDWIINRTKVCKSIKSGHSFAPRPVTVFSSLFCRGLLALSAGSFDEAHRHFVAATKLDPYNSVVGAMAVSCKSFCYLSIVIVHDQ